MNQAIFVAQIAVSVLIIIAVLMQNRGAGLSAVFGGGGSVYRTKRGVEKGIYYSTIVLIILFIALGVTSLVISA